MRITLIAIGNKMPSWVQLAVQDYAKRLQDTVSLTIIEIPLTRRGKSSDLVRILEKEAAMMKTAIPEHSHIIALDRTGQSFTSEQLAITIERLQHRSPHLVFLIGGPEGLSADLLAISQERWSLSALTLPHTLARITLLETLYRAYSIILHHPYHK